MMLVACGGRVVVERDDSGGGGAHGSSTTASGSPTGGPDAGGAGAGAGQGGGWTECSSPEGYAICNGPADCPHDFKSPTCPDCINASADISICANEVLAKAKIGYCWLAPDGRVCVDVAGSNVDPSYMNVPFSVGILYKNAGYSKRVRYADYSLFTGQPLPEPESCPTIEGVTLCGGKCGGCPPDAVCTGRSPLHPYGVCAPLSAPCEPGSGEYCKPGYSCFQWVVEPAAQAMSDEYGIGCFPELVCNKLAAEIPGGGKCVMP
jgi:hypothetical protein